IRQLTHHSSTDLVDSWSWDSKEIYFTSSRANRFTSFKVNVEGGTPKRVFKHYFNTIHNVVETPQGDLLFNDTWESFSAANRKRYKGEFNPDILAYHPKTKTYKELTQYEGKDFWASVDKKANVYFASDEGNDEYNLYTFLKGEKTALTSFNTSIKDLLCQQMEKKWFLKKIMNFISMMSRANEFINPRSVLERITFWEKRENTM